MGIIFKKGHIIPRWCHVKTTDRKAQHNCTFGCDVEVVLKGGSTKYSIAVINHVHGDFSRRSL